MGRLATFRKAGTVKRQAVLPSTEVEVTMGSRGTGHSREAWNKGKLVGQKLPLKVKDIWAIRVRLQMQERIRDLALFDLGIDSKLRACDLVKLRVRDVCHATVLRVALSCCNRRRSDRFNLRLPRRCAKHSSHGLGLPVESGRFSVFEPVEGVGASRYSAIRSDRCPAFPASCVLSVYRTAVVAI